MTVTETPETCWDCTGTSTRDGLRCSLCVGTGEIAVITVTTHTSQKDTA